MAGVNKVILIGRLGKDPEVRTMESGRKVANLTLATSETYKDKNGEKQEITEWHNINFWGPAAEVLEKYLKKGSQLYVEGKLRTRSYEDKDGNKKYVTEILGENFTFLGGGNRPEGSGYEKTTSAAEPSFSASSADTDDDLPF